MPHPNDFADTVNPLTAGVSPTRPISDIGQHLLLQERSPVLPYQSTRLNWYDAVS